MAAGAPRFAAALALAAALAAALGAPPAAAQPGAPRERGPTTIEAETIEGVSELEVTARGRAELKRDDLTIFGELLRYNQEFGRVEADGGVRLERGGERFFGPRLRYDTIHDSGVFEEPSFVIRREQTARGGAERIEFRGRDRLSLVRGSFTTCEPGKEDWRFEAGEIELDYESEIATVRDGRLRFFDTTILALPYGSFPLEKRRKTGFLTPYYSQNTRRGLELGVPFYWNIAPERDLTLTPVYTSRRGPQLKTEFRYIDPRYSGELRWEHMPEDRVLKHSRSGFTLQHRHQFAPALAGTLDLNKVTDSRYFVDLGSQVRQVSVGNLNREGVLSYGGGLGATGYWLRGRVQRFQTLQDPLAPIVSPYHRVPQLDFGAVRNDLGGFADLAVPGEHVRFTHDRLVRGTRFSLNPSLAVPFLAPGHFLVPRLGLRYADYRLTQTAPGQPQRQRVSVPWASLDAGLVFERGLRWFGEPTVQTLEPRLFYVYVPYRGQDRIPLFDTALQDFNYATLFTENRFSGGDRFGDANQATVALTSRIVAPGGEELLRATVGQRYYFKNERIGLTPAAPLRSRDQSDILASVGGRFARHWTLDATVQYNPQLSQPERFNVALRYAPEIARVLNASYRFNRDVLRQIDISGQWPLAPGWFAIGRYNYSLRDSRLLEGLAGFEYNAGCWILRGVFQRLQAAVQTTSTAILFQLEFNGFGSIGSDEVIAFLKRSVPGYAPTGPREGHLVPPGVQRPLPFEQIF